VTFVDHLSQYAPAQWAGAIETLAPEIHAIDLNASRVWFALFPTGPSPDQIASSHAFLFGHRHWPQIKRAILATAKECAWAAGLPDLIVTIADHATRTAQVDRDQLLGVTAASLLTLRHVGLEAFTAAPGTVQLPHWSHVRSVRQVRSARVRRRWQVLGTSSHRVRFSEATRDAYCDVPSGATIASALPASERRCGSTCTGACVVGVLAGAQALSAIDDKEQALLTKVGVRQVMSADSAPLIRLACHARPTGDVTLAFPNPVRPTI
jgi:hypothetical protein